MPYKCYMVELRNPHLNPRHTCDKEHAENEPCNDNKVYVETEYDICRVDTGEVLKSGVTGFYGVRDFVGAMWWENYGEANMPRRSDDWDHLSDEDRKRIQGPDGSMPARHPSFIFAEGPQLTVETPGGRWVIDSRASNCTMPFDYEHRCWIRHGEPPNIHVDKNGITCAAGAGSIQCGSYHGFLHNGELTDG